MPTPSTERGRAKPILFAHRGASAHAPENTIAAFRLAIDLGATGLESDVHLDAAGVPILVHDAEIEGPTGPVRVRDARVIDLHALGVPALAELYAAVGDRWPLSLDLNDLRAIETARAVIGVAHRQGGAPAVRRLYLCHDDLDVLATIATERPDAPLVWSTKRKHIGPLDGEGFRDLLLGAHARGISVLNLHREDWEADGAAAAIAAVHRVGLRAFAWDTQLEPEARRMLEAGADGVYADDPGVLVRAARS